LIAAHFDKTCPIIMENFNCELQNMMKKKLATTNRKLRSLVNKEYKTLTSNRSFTLQSQQNNQQFYESRNKEITVKFETQFTIKVWNLDYKLGFRSRNGIQQVS
jgi:hypothetical protein